MSVLGSLLAAANAEQGQPILDLMRGPNGIRMRKPLKACLVLLQPAAGEEKRKRKKPAEGAAAPPEPWPEPGARGDRVGLVAEG